MAYQLFPPLLPLPPQKYIYIKQCPEEKNKLLDSNFFQIELLHP